MSTFDSIPAFSAYNLYKEGKLRAYKGSKGWLIDLDDLCYEIGYLEPVKQARILRSRLKCFGLTDGGEPRFAATLESVLPFLSRGVHGSPRLRDGKESLYVDIVTGIQGIEAQEPQPVSSSCLVEAMPAFQESLSLLADCGATPKQIAYFKLEYYSRFASSEVKPVFEMAQSALKAMDVLQFASPPTTNGRVACN